MKASKKIISVLAATALATAFAIPAFADTPGAESSDLDQAVTPGGAFTSPTDITATVHAPGAKVVKVTVPSKMPINIATMDSSGKHVIDPSKTLPVTAEVRNYSTDGTVVDVSVSRVVDDDGLLDAVGLTLAPSMVKGSGTAGSAYAMVKSNAADAKLFTALAGSADGVSDPGTGLLTLTASDKGGADLSPFEVAPHTVTAVLKVSVPTA